MKRPTLSLLLLALLGESAFGAEFTVFEGTFTAQESTSVVYFGGQGPFPALMEIERIDVGKGRVLLNSEQVFSSQQIAVLGQGEKISRQVGLFFRNKWQVTSPEGGACTQCPELKIRFRDLGTNLLKCSFGQDTGTPCETNTFGGLRGEFAVAGDFSGRVLTDGQRDFTIRRVERALTAGADPDEEAECRAGQSLSVAADGAIDGLGFINCLEVQQMQANQTLEIRILQDTAGGEIVLLPRRVFRSGEISRMFGIPGDGPFDDLEGVLSLNGTGTVELNGAAVTPGAVPLQGLNDLLVRPQGTLNVSVTIDDGESPEVFASFSPPANRFGWNNETIELAPFCIDALSGVKECPEPAEWENQGLLDKLSIADLINNSVGDQIGAADRVDNRPDTTTAVTLVDGTPIRFKLDRAAPQVLAGDTGGGLVDVPRVRIDWQIRDNCSGVRGLAVNGIENSLASTEDADGAIFALTGELQGRAGALGSYTCDGTQTKRVHQGSSIDTAISQSWGLDCESEVGGETFRFQTDLSCSLDLDLCNAVDGERISLAAELTDFANNRAEEFVGLTLFRPRLGPGCLALLGNRYARTGQGGAFTIPNVVQGSWPQRVRLLCGREEEARNQGQSAAAPIEPAVGLRTEVQEIRFCPFEPAIAELAVGVAGTVEFGATTPLDLAAVPQGTAFTTSNPAVAVIEGSQVRAVSLGRALVVARYEGLVATAEITVVPATGGGDGGGDDGGGDDGGGDDGGGGDGGGGGRPGPRPPVEPPVEPLVARPGSDATLPLDGSLTLGEDPPAAGGTPPYSFFWSLSRSRAGLLSSTTDANPVLTVTERGLLAVNLVVRDSAGAVALGQLEVNIVCPTLKQLDERLVGARIELLRSSTAGDGSQAEIAGEILKILQRIEECTSPAASGGAPR